MLKETSYNVYRQAITFEKLSLFFYIFRFQSLEKNLFHLHHPSVFLQEYKHETFSSNIFIFFKINVYLSILSLV